MTYCLGIVTKDGLVMASDSRTNAGYDQVNICSKMHVFDATVMPPKQISSISLRDQPGWITFSLDGKFAYPSTGEVIDTASKNILTTLEDEAGRAVQSEKVVEIVMSDGKVVRTGDQFGIGRRR